MLLYLVLYQQHLTFAYTQSSSFDRRLSTILEVISIKDEIEKISNLKSGLGKWRTMSNPSLLFDIEH